MFNPIEIKHDYASRPLKFLVKEMNEWGAPPSSSSVLLLIPAIGVTAAVNLMPALGLIDAGFRGERIFSHVTYTRFNPWAKPIFHYTQAASKAERIGAAFGRPIGKFVSGTMWPNFSRTRAVWQKGGAKAGAKIGARIGGRLIPGVGWALLAYDVYDVAFNQSLWGFDFA